MFNILTLGIISIFGSLIFVALNDENEEITFEKKKEKEKIKYINKNYLYSKDDKKGMILSDNIQMKLDKMYEGVVVVGKPGSNKTTGIAIPSILEITDASMIITDPKGEISYYTKEVKQKQGYTIYEIDLTSPHNRYKVDFLKYFKENERIDVLTQILTTDSNISSEWKEMGMLMINFITHYIAYHKKIKNKSLSQIIDFTINKNFDTEEEFDTLDNINFPAEDKNDFENYTKVKEKYNLFIRSKGSKATYGSIVAVTNSILQKYNSSNVRNFLTIKEGDKIIDFEELRKKKIAIYLKYSELEADAVQNVLTLFFYTLFLQMSKLPSTEDLPILCMFDEFANIGEIPNLEKIISTFRGRKIGLIMFLQTISQLENIYKNYQSILGSISTKVFLKGLSEEKDIEYIQKLGGEKYYAEKTFNESGKLQGVRNTKENRLSTNYIRTFNYTNKNVIIFFKDTEEITDTITPFFTKEKYMKMINKKLF